MKKMNVESETVVQLMEDADESLRGCGLEDKNLQKVRPVLQAIADRLGLTEDESLMLCCLFNMHRYYNIDMDDMCSYFSCRPLKVLKYRKVFESLSDRQVVFIRRDNVGNVNNYTIRDGAIRAIQEGHLPEKVSYKGLSKEKWLDCVDVLLKQCGENELTPKQLLSEICELVEENLQLPIARYVAQYLCCQSELFVLLVTLNSYVQEQDEEISEYDIRDVVQDRIERKRQLREIRNNTHLLLREEVIEHVNNDGQVNPTTWKLTNKTKSEWLGELEPLDSFNTKLGLITADKIGKKELFFNTSVSKQVGDLRALLEQERFKQVQEQLARNGMRCGFACIFYGAPGTGKTETVLQLARETGRAIMQVDIPNLRSKWVGDTEKNMKGIFDHYRACCKKSVLAPILLFNEADAVLCKRNESAVTGVDKMENSLQNIILQEMENLNGIMIATTNLASNLDAAFERRFLYKIEFPKPTAKERQHIWHTMLPAISESDALLLAEHYSFSGGQIENIARKQIVSSILCGTDSLSMATIRESCECELLDKKTTRKIGFC